MLAGHGHYPRQVSSDGKNRNLVMPVGLQLDSHENAAELRDQWADAKNA